MIRMRFSLKTILFIVIPICAIVSLSIAYYLNVSAQRAYRLERLHGSASHYPRYATTGEIVVSEYDVEYPTALSEKEVAWREFYGTDAFELVRSIDVTNSPEDIALLKRTPNLVRLSITLSQDNDADFLGQLPKILSNVELIVFQGEVFMSVKQFLDPEHRAFDNDHAVGEFIRAIVELPKLKSLTVLGNYEVDLLDPISRMKGLERLKFNSIDAGADGFAKLQHLTRLKYLNLSYTSISDASLRHFAGMRELQHLSLQRTIVKGNGLKYIADLPSLVELNLDDTQLATGLKASGG